MCKKILTYLVLFLSVLACERKPLYLRSDAALNVNVEVSAEIRALWDESWEDSLKYEWDEDKYGKLGYTLPEECYIVVFNNKEMVAEKQIKVGKRELIDIDLNKTYDMLIYARENFWLKTSYDDEKYFIEVPSQDTKADKDETVDQPGEVFAANKNNLYISDDLSEFEEVFEDGKLIYVYNIDEKLGPVSYIYVIQFIVINDDHSERIEAKDIAGFTINGISIKKNLLKNEPVYTPDKQIEAFDIKPGQERKDSLIFASRVTILDLLPDNPETSWTSEIEYRCFASIDVNTYSYGEVKGTKDITDQLKKNPKGGVITVRIMNSELKQGGESGSGFGVDLGDWNEHEYDIT